ncbi:DNA-binding response regulator, OmpR family, contains REC and winged-helix (wHTH) domain [Plantibacter flavus]|uniref:DNA-binding response OmpR family regulator n=1 Tax=Plantibacter flavus TaxID=150123 RepID=A0A3N2BXY5_9MICO|nr:response regulator transcription factor [Plantibacter flavus]ROR80109.1 DNA-binding response OmpR family regulator [Plantibacter flavus]SMG29385.1 DNA-binding response regulator, OmpR family, contains REC and winged-helix (wHTH) domain [Plantibacter flavus]
MSSLPTSETDPLLADRRILIVEDDPTVLEVAESYLRAAGFIVDTARDGFTALEIAARRAPDLVVLDRMLPGIDGLEVCHRLRALRSMPIIMLTALGGTEDRIAGLEAGADDYLAKPFSPRELVLRVQSILRRVIGEFTPEASFSHGPFTLDPSARTVERDGTALALSAREFDLFAFLLKHPRQAFSREQLLRAVWGWDFGDLSTVTVTVRRVREKIETEPTRPTILATVWGVGYRLDL